MANTTKAPMIAARMMASWVVMAVSDRRDDIDTLALLALHLLDPSQ